MATSPIYGWLEPDNTDLVKNGALAIRTLGNAIDTTMGTMTPKSIVDAKGDLIAASANDTPARLAVGNNGETLVADSSTATGLRYQGSMAAGKNAVINGAFDIWQRGTSIALTASAYTADRWQGYRGTSNGNVTRQATGDTTNLPFIQYCARVQRDSGTSATNTLYVGQSFETINSIPYAGKTLTFSYYARKGANYSSASDALTISMASGTGTDQNYVSAGYTGSTSLLNTSSTLTATWQRFSHTVTVPSTATELGFFFAYTPVGTAGAADYFEVTGVQLEVGSVATNFARTGGTIQGELAACQRYYYRYTPTTSYDAITTFGIASSTTRAWPQMALPVTLRTIPSAVEYSTTYSLYSLTDVNSEYSSTAISIDAAGSSTQIVQLLIDVASGLTANRMYKLISASGATSGGGYIGVSAEL